MMGRRLFPQYPQYVPGKFCVIQEFDSTVLRRALVGKLCCQKSMHLQCWVSTSLQLENELTFALFLSEDQALP